MIGPGALALTANEFFRKLLFLPPERSEFARAVDHLHFSVILTTLFAGGGILLLAVYFVVRYRQHDPDQTTPAVPPNRPLEVAYIGVPLAIFLVWFFVGFRLFVRANTPPPDAMDVYVTAKQWMWKFTYPQGPNAIGVLRVPVGKPVRLLMTSRDVIHSFFVPDFRLKQDVLPGRYTETWFVATKPGTYDVFCAEYCGLLHSRMTAEVVVLPPAEFQRWLAQQEEGLARRRDASPSDREHLPASMSMVEQGRRLAADEGCLNCHSTNGAPDIGPTWKDLYMRRERLSDGSTVVATEGYLTESMMYPGAKIVAGYANVMPSFQGKLSAPDAAAIVEYIESLRSPGIGHEKTGGPAFVPADGSH